MILSNRASASRRSFGATFAPGLSCNSIIGGRRSLWLSTNLHPFGALHEGHNMRLDWTIDASCRSIIHPRQNEWSHSWVDTIQFSWLHGWARVKSSILHLSQLGYPPLWPVSRSATLYSSKQIAHTSSFWESLSWDMAGGFLPREEVRITMLESELDLGNACIALILLGGPWSEFEFRKESGLETDGVECPWPALDRTTASAVFRLETIKAIRTTLSHMSETDKEKSLSSLADRNDYVNFFFFLLELQFIFFLKLVTMCY